MFNYVLFTAMLGTVLFANKRTKHTTPILLQRRTYRIESHTYTDILADPILHAHIRRLRRADGVLTDKENTKSHELSVLCMYEGKKVIAALAYTDAAAPYANAPVDMGALHMSRGVFVYRFSIAEKYVNHAPAVYARALDELETHVSCKFHYVVVAANVPAHGAECLARGYTRVYGPRKSPDAYYIKYIYTHITPHCSAVCASPNASYSSSSQVVFVDHK